MIGRPACVRSFPSRWRKDAHHSIRSTFAPPDLRGQRAEVGRLGAVGEAMPLSVPSWVGTGHGSIPPVSLIENHSASKGTSEKGELRG